MKNIIKRIKSLFSKEDKLKSKFTEIHDKNLFFGTDSISGTGSDMIQTEVISKEIPKLLERYNIRIFVDAPCGDFHWMQHVQFNKIKYIGLDIVDELIEKNNKKYANEFRAFYVKNIVTDKMPDADLIMIRDCWVHLSNSDVKECVKNLKSSDIKYLLTTSFTEMKLNEDLTQIWRPLNLELEPFSFPEPTEVINERCLENNGIFKDKSLILWEISQLPDFKD